MIAHVLEELKSLTMIENSSRPIFVSENINLAGVPPDNNLGFTVDLAVL
jgi:hypothetical protein